jgi:hypothetical protein
MKRILFPIFAVVGLMLATLGVRGSDLPIIGANVVQVSGIPVGYTAGATITQGQVVYLNSSNQVVLAQATSSTAVPAIGIALNSAASGQPIQILTSGVVTLGVLANPTVQATCNPTGAGGALQAGTYYVAYTFVTAGNGETAVGTSESAQMTVTSGQKPIITVPSLPAGATSINLYSTVAGGAKGTEVLYATGIVATTYTMATATAGGVSPPPSLASGYPYVVSAANAGNIAPWGDLVSGNFVTFWATAPTPAAPSSSFQSSRPA